MNCAMCGIQACKNRLEGAPKNCPSLDENIDNIKKYIKLKKIILLQKSLRSYLLNKEKQELKKH